MSEDELDKLRQKRRTAAGIMFENRDAFERAIQAAIEHAYERESGDYALKIYFHPFTALFFTDEEWVIFMEPDECCVKVTSARWVVEEGGKRLAGFVKSLAIPHQDMYLSVIVYGLITSPNINSIDVVYQVNADGTLHIDRLERWR